MAKIDIEDYDNLIDFTKALRNNNLKHEFGDKNLLPQVKNLRKYFNIDDISARCKGIITKDFGKKTFVSVRKYWSEEDIFRMTMKRLGITLSRKWSAKYFKAYGIKYPRES